MLPLQREAGLASKRLVGLSQQLGSERKEELGQQYVWSENTLIATMSEYTRRYLSKSGELLVYRP